MYFSRLFLTLSGGNSRAQHALARESNDPVESLQSWVIVILQGRGMSCTGLGEVGRRGDRRALVSKFGVCIPSNSGLASEFLLGERPRWCQGVFLYMYIDMHVHISWNILQPAARLEKVYVEVNPFRRSFETFPLTRHMALFWVVKGNSIEN